MSSDPVIILIMAAATLMLLRFWRIVLALMLSVAIAVFCYGVITLTDLMRT